MSDFTFKRNTITFSRSEKKKVHFNDDNTEEEGKTNLTDDNSNNTDCSDFYSSLPEAETLSSRGQTKRSSFETDYPQMFKRSKSTIFKKKIAIDVVNEETNEEDADTTTLKKSKFPTASDFKEDGVILKNKLNTMVSISYPSPKVEGYKTINSVSYMDPVVEVKEEAEVTKNEKRVHHMNSPRMHFMTDMREDTISPKSTYHNTSSFSNIIYKNWETMEEAIQEDNNENIPEQNLKRKDSKSKLKFSENIIRDKTDDVCEQGEVDFKLNEMDIEVIKEENAEEEEVLRDKFRTTNGTHLILI
jgi:hypothetical protein